MRTLKHRTRVVTLLGLLGLLAPAGLAQEGGKPATPRPAPAPAQAQPASKPQAPTTEGAVIPLKNVVAEQADRIRGVLLGIRQEVYACDGCGETSATAKECCEQPMVAQTRAVVADVSLHADKGLATVRVRTGGTLRLSQVERALAAVQGVEARVDTSRFALTTPTWLVIEGVANDADLASLNRALAESGQLEIQRAEREGTQRALLLARPKGDSPVLRDAVAGVVTKTARGAKLVDLAWGQQVPSA